MNCFARKGRLENIENKGNKGKGCFGGKGRNGIFFNRR